MCEYCERRTDIKFGWEQPKLYDKSKNAPFGDQFHGNIGDDWEARIHDYQTTTPEIIMTSKNMAEYLWGGNDGVATLYLPVHYCPICGRKLGKNINQITNADKQHNKTMLREGTIVMHFKHQYCTDTQKQHNKYLYKIMGQATNTETGENTIVYQAMYPPYEAFVRPEEMFYQKVDQTKYPDCTQTYRFVVYQDKLPENQEKLKLAIKQAHHDIAFGHVTALSEIIPEIEYMMLDNANLDLNKLQEYVINALVSASDDMIFSYIKNSKKGTNV